jgi:hypothetical protein
MCPELPEHRHASLARQLASPLAGVNAKRAQSFACKALQQRAIVAAYVNHQIIGSQPQFSNNMGRQMLKVIYDWNI